MNFSKHGRFLVFALLLAALFFALGLMSSSFFGAEKPASVPAHAPSAASAPLSAQTAKEPKIIFDPNSIELLPDASLQISPIPPPSASGIKPIQ